MCIRPYQNCSFAPVAPAAALQVALVFHTPRKLTESYDPKNRLPGLGRRTLRFSAITPKPPSWPLLFFGSLTKCHTLTFVIKRRFYGPHAHQEVTSIGWHQIAHWSCVLSLFPCVVLSFVPSVPLVSEVVSSVFSGRYGTRASKIYHSHIHQKDGVPVGSIPFA